MKGMMNKEARIALHIGKRIALKESFPRRMNIADLSITIYE